MQIAECLKCGLNHVRFLSGWLPTDEDFIRFFGRNVTALMDHFGHTFPSAVKLAKDYYRDFTDPAYCEAIGVPTQSDEFMWHEGLDMANRIHYYLALRLDPDPHSYIEWRAQHYRERKAGEIRSNTSLERTRGR